MTPRRIRESAGRLAERMHVNPVTIDPEASLDQAREMFSNYRFRHLPVVSCNEVVGIVSDRDLRLATGLRPDRERLQDSQGKAIPGATQVSQIMRSPVRAMSDQDSLEEAALVMLRESIGAIPVRQGDALIGIVTETDVLRAYKEFFDRSDAPAEDRVRVHMHAPVTSVEPELKVDSALDELDRRIGHLIVEEDGCMVGIVSERDLLTGLSQEMTQDERAQSEGYFAEVELPVQAVMSSPVTSVSENDPLSFAAGVMIRQKFSALPVLDASGSVVGILTQRDILEEFVALTEV